MPYYFPPNACEKWELEFETRLGTKLAENPCVNTKDSGVVAFRWFVPWAGHAAYRVVLANGEEWYVDNGGLTTIGDSTHVGTELPVWIY